MSDYLAMGGYAAFVWPAYGVAAVVLVGLWILSQRRRRAAERMARELEPGTRGEAS